MADSVTKLPVKRETAISAPLARQPARSLREEINRLFDEFDFGLTGWPLQRSFLGNAAALARVNAPAVDIAETDKAFEVTAELPGMTEKDVEVELVNGDLRIKGEKKEEREEKNKDYYLSERRYGTFERRFPVPDGVDTAKIEARVKNGVLSVSLPKAETTPPKKLEVKGA